MQRGLIFVGTGMCLLPGVKLPGGGTSSCVGYQNGSVSLCQPFMWMPAAYTYVPIREIVSDYELT
jgi:hypothetical protein